MHVPSSLRSLPHSIVLVIYVRDSQWIHHLIRAVNRADVVPGGVVEDGIKVTDLKNRAGMEPQRP